MKYQDVRDDAIARANATEYMASAAPSGGRTAQAHEVASKMIPHGVGQQTS